MKIHSLILTLIIALGICGAIALVTIFISPYPSFG